MKTNRTYFASVRDTGEPIQGTYKSQIINWLVRMYSLISRVRAYACAGTQARKAKKIKTLIILNF